MIRRIVTQTAVALLVVGSLLGAGTGLLGCAPSLPSEPAGIHGTVTSLVPGDARPASILVVGPKNQQSGAVADQAQVTIAPQTLFFDAAGKPGDPASIRVGTKVVVWFEGAVAESYPVQGTARAVQIGGK
jgi:hypothetical protein